MLEEGCRKDQLGFFMVLGIKRAGFGMDNVNR